MANEKLNLYLLLIIKKSCIRKRKQYKVRHNQKLRYLFRKMAEGKAEIEYNKFNKHQNIPSDFDKLLLNAKNIKNDNKK